VRGVLVHAMSGTELSRVRTEFRLRFSRAYQQKLTRVEGADIVMQSSKFQSKHTLTSRLLVHGIYSCRRLSHSEGTRPAGPGAG
jgi:hypothetical protein